MQAGSNASKEQRGQEQRGAGNGRSWIESATSGEMVTNGAFCSREEWEGSFPICPPRETFMRDLR